MDSDDVALYEALTDIQGIGDAKATQILELVEDHHSGDETVAVAGLLDDAVSYADQGDYEYAMKFVRRARELV